MLENQQQQQRWTSYSDAFHLRKVLAKLVQLKDELNYFRAENERLRACVEHWRFMDKELPPPSDDFVVVARHLDGFDTVIGYDGNGEWVGNGGLAMHLSEYYAWTLVPRCNLPVPFDAQTQEVGDGR